MLETIKKYMEDHPGYSCFGIRADDKKYEVGEEVRRSFVWEDGNRTEEKLEGSCAIWIYNDLTNAYNEKAIDRVKDMYEYTDGYIYLIASRTCQGGEDRDEWIMPEAIVVEVL